MSILTLTQCEEIFGIVEREARSRGVRDVEVIAGGGAESLTRFANNTIHQNVSELSRHASVRIVENQRTARASTNRLDADGLREVVEQAIAIARCSEPDPELLPLPAAAAVEAAQRHFPLTAGCTPEQRARVVANAIRIVESESQTAAGIYSTEETAEALLNTNGIACFHTETMARFSITAMAADSSGWAKASSPDIAAFDPAELARRAAAKARISARPRELDPGRYTVILEPAAVLDLIGQMFGDFSATALADQRSFLNERLGEALFSPAIQIADDVHHPLQSGTPFEGDGVPRRRLALVENGVPRELAYSRAAAHKAGVEPTGHGFPLPNEYGESPANIVMRGGDSSLQQLIESTPRGILVTRLWYIREVDPYEKIMTGMTRDGTFLVENGEVAGGILNFRFNQGLIELLRNVEAMTREERASGEEAFDMVVPALKAHDFNFTEVTRF
jgi:predicted Zn-dependent protease